MDESSRMNFGEMIRSKRLERGYRICSAATQVGTNYSSLRLIELGQLKPSDVMISRMSKLYDISEQVLLAKYKETYGADAEVRIDRRPNIPPMADKIDEDAMKITKRHVPVLKIFEDGRQQRYETMKDAAEDSWVDPHTVRNCALNTKAGQNHFMKRYGFVFIKAEVSDGAR